MSTQTSVHLTPAATVDAKLSGQVLWLNVRPDGTRSSEVTLFLGTLDGPESTLQARWRIDTLIHALREAYALLPEAGPNEPGPDDPTDEPEEAAPAQVQGTRAEVVDMSDDALRALAGEPGALGWDAAEELDRRGALGPREVCPVHGSTCHRVWHKAQPVCLYCGHDGTHEPRAAGCAVCNRERPLGACHSAGALADASWDALQAQGAPESELRLLAGDR